MYIFVIFTFVVFYWVSVMSVGQKPKIQRYMLVVSCLILAFLAGFRDPDRWADTSVYIDDFEYYTNPLYKFSLNDQPFGYAERGFHFLGSIVKTFTDNATIYLISISALTFFFIYKSIDKYCIFPLLGLCDYIARFILNRNFIQIRSALAIAIIIFGIQYAYKRDWHKYFIFVAVAYLFHHIAILAVPFYFFNKVQFSKSQIVKGLLVAVFLAAFFSSSISSYVDNWSTDMNYANYTGEEYKNEDLGIANPMIYFQIIILLIFTFNEKKLCIADKYYYLYRNAYFFSTLILVTFCKYTALSGRTSTMFATVEISIIPLLAKMYKKRERYIFYIALCILLTGFFYLKLRPTN